MAPEQSGKSFRSLLGMPPSKPTPKDSVLVIVDAQNEYGKCFLFSEYGENTNQKKCPSILSPSYAPSRYS